jgi:acyl-coenzyme A thioesterase PaaI-like protein
LKEIHGEGHVIDATSEFTNLSGLQQLQAIFAGETGYTGIVKTLDLHLVSAEEGCVVFAGSPTQAVYNPLGSVHGRYTATFLTHWPGCGLKTQAVRILGGGK